MTDQQDAFDKPPADPPPGVETPAEIRAEPPQDSLSAPVGTGAVGDAAVPVYRVLARKYRPANFDELIGQDALVRTLTNAIQTDRIAQAYMLTGVRGVGKTTTARIIARALNCIGPDGTGGPTAAPCGVCEHCVGIAEDRHVDVIEMDAASRAGVGDIRELIDGVRYKPISARYKVYIIDEVHMLSTQAFNALLKTLEEPPEHVKFVFATTEIRKVPITVLSRCQRFDLRRVDADLLAAHFGRIATAEGAAPTPPALALLARAADGSVRDGLSLLDQAISTFSDGPIEEDQIRGMLGLADRTRIFDLFEALMRGEIKAALEEFEAVYRDGADPLVVIQDLMELVHWITRAKLVPTLLDDPVTPEAERTRGRTAAEGLAMPVLTRAWQMLLKGLAEVQSAPSAMRAAEMVMIRLAYVADMPTPGDLVKQIQNAETAPSGGGSAGSSGAGSAGGSAGGSGGAPGGGVRAVANGGGAPQREAGSVAVSAPKAEAAPEPAGPVLENFEAVVALFDDQREALLAAQLRNNVRLVRFEAGHIEINPDDQAASDLANRVGRMLTDWTGRRWIVSVSQAEGAPSLRDQARMAVEARKADAASDPVVRAVLEEFPGAEIVEVRELPGTAPVEAADEAGDILAPESSIDPDDDDAPWEDA
ncbi:MAG: DNA polymerase III subunit gamma/tau [Proteobacteria bacterium]|nr:DNA polymerase III subunit gamma/tau [Pseudomonadota bacterium]